MVKNLVIVESPTKAKTIKKMLGRNYNVIASVGHIRDLPKSRIGIDIEKDFEPEYINIRGKGSIIKELKKNAKEADNVFLATDPDREGEAISWHLCHILELDPKGKNRVTFNEITKDTVKSQIKNPREIDMYLVDAQQARRLLDRLAGYKISPFLWKKIKSGLSAGRVQSVVLKIICDREKEIEEFIPEEYFTIEAEHKKNKTSFTSEFYGKLIKDKIEKVKISNEKEAKEILKSINKKNFSVFKLDKGTKRRQAFNPFTTSTLQQEASRKIGFSTKKTMRIAQSLYEGINLPSEGSVGLITYMRTDSVRISDQAQAKAFEFIEKNYGKNYLGHKKTTKAKQGVQDAHECIRPTDVFKSPSSIKEALSRDELKLYTLIWKRFLASLMADAVYDTISLDLKSNDNIFKARGSKINFEGFLRVYDLLNEKDKLLPDLLEGEILNTEKVEPIKHFTQGPPRYNEASLIKLLEDLGIGRPSTYSPTISTLQSRNYVSLEDKKFIPTELGETVNKVLSKYFKEIVDKNFTAKLEDDLDKIADGNLQWKEVLREFYDGIKEDLKVAEDEMDKIKIEDEVTDEICEKCGRHMVIKMGRYGKFLACPGFPECRNSKPLLEKIGLKCPKCNDGEIVIKRSKKGRKFYGCSNYPKCDFVSWNEPVDKKCPKCSHNLSKVTTRKGLVLKCENCGYVEEKNGN